MKKYAATISLLALALAGCSAPEESTEVPSSPPAVVQTTEAPAPQQPAPTTPPAAPETTPPPAAPDTTPSQQNALESAERYLETMGMSKTGLVTQLEFEQYSTEDATWAAENVEADWNAEAAESAKSYLDTMSFSRAGLVDQLVFEGFTPEEAEYGVTQAGL